MLTGIAYRLNSTWWLRHLYFLACAFLAILLVGYYFGTFDQGFHIPFLQKYLDPSLYPGDPFLDLRFSHYSYFWFLFAPFYRLNLLEPAMFVVHVLATYATFWMFWELAQTLFKIPHQASLLQLLSYFPTSHYRDSRSSNIVCSTDRSFFHSC